MNLTRLKTHDRSATVAALHDEFHEDCVLVSQVFMDAWLESAAVVADIESQHTAVQHLLVSTVAMHREQQQLLQQERQQL